MFKLTLLPTISVQKVVVCGAVGAVLSQEEYSKFVRQAYYKLLMRHKLAITTIPPSLHASSTIIVLLHPAVV